MSKLTYKVIAAVLAVLMAASCCGTSPALAKSKKKEKKEVTLSKTSVEANTYEEFSIRLKSSHEAWYYYCDVKKYNEESGSYTYVYGSTYTYYEEDSGKFTFTFYEGGEYEITATLVEYGEDNGYMTYSDTCKAKIKNVGPKERKFVLLIGSSRELTVENAKFISARVKEAYYWDGNDYGTSGYGNWSSDSQNDVSDENGWDDYNWDYGGSSEDDDSWDDDNEWDYDDYWYDSYWYNSGKVEIDGNKVTGTAAGTVTLIVSYIPDGGSTTEAEVLLEVTDPQYTPVEGYLLANDAVCLKVNGASSYSKVSVESDDEKVCTPDGGYWIYTRGAGTCNIKITVDGREFTDKVEVYDPQISSEAILIKKNKSVNLTVKGLPDDIKPTFKTDNKKIATVSKNGKVKAKAVGNTCITVSCGNLITFACMVTVSKGGAGFDAAKSAYKVIGSQYSQTRRMEEGYYDCSSLAWRSYKAAGEYLLGEKKYAPTAADLAKGLEAEGKAIAYEYVSADELLPGDLIFYSSSSNGRYKNIDHVAVYYAIGGTYSDWDGSTSKVGLMVHATSPTVNLTVYDWYIPYCIVMICRPK